MFGYIKPYKPEMKIKEFDTFKAVYCGLCKQLGKVYGPFARMTLNYDFTFLSILTLAVKEENAEFQLQGCMVNPLKKKPCLCACGDLTFGASAAMLMLYYKVKDNIHDSRFFGKLKYLAVLPSASRARRKAKKLYPEMDEIMSAYITAQQEIERGDAVSIDRAAEPTATALSKIFAQIGGTETQAKVLSRLGYLTGRYIYLMDALDDLEDDIKSGGYNIFYKKYQAEQMTELSQIRGYAREALQMTAGEIASAYELLELYHYRPILNNIIYLGLHMVLKQVLAKHDGAGTRQYAPEQTQPQAKKGI